jgi:hypothetical protein
MNRMTAMSVLAAAALLESGGDAIMRVAVQNNTPALTRFLLFLGAAAILTGYGWTVNAPPWDFGKLIGIYVVFFFIIGQMISWLVFKQQPSLSSIVAGVMIVGGGVVFTVGNR